MSTEPTTFDYVPAECAVACMYAHDDLCRCWCGGINHGKFKREWHGYFCEDCEAWFGKDPCGVWNRGAVISCGCSKKYKTKAGNPQIAYWCARCWQKKRPNEIVLSEDGRYRWRERPKHAWGPEVQHA